MTSGWPKSLLLLCCSTFDHVILYFPRAGHHLKENKRRTQRASLLFPAVFNAKGHIQTKLSTFRAWSFSPYIYYKFALGTKPIKWSCPAGTAHWMFTLKQNNCLLSLSTTCPSLAEWLLFHWVCQWLYSAQCHQPMVESLGGVSGLYPLWGCSTLPLLQQTCHKPLHMCGILLC